MARIPEAEARPDGAMIFCRMKSGSASKASTNHRLKFSARFLK